MLWHPLQSMLRKFHRGGTVLPCCETIDMPSFHHTDLLRIERKIDVILQKLGIVLQSEKIMSVELDALIAQVKANTDTEASAVIAIKGLIDKVAALAAAGGTPAQFTELAAELKASADALGAAVPVNTAAAAKKP